MKSAAFSILFAVFCLFSARAGTNELFTDAASWTGHVYMAIFGDSLTTGGGGTGPGPSGLPTAMTNYASVGFSITNSGINGGKWSNGIPPSHLTSALLLTPRWIYIHLGVNNGNDCFLVQQMVPCVWPMIATNLEWCASNAAAVNCKLLIAEVMPSYTNLTPWATPGYHLLNYSYAQWCATNQYSNSTKISVERDAMGQTNPDTGDLDYLRPNFPQSSSDGLHLSPEAYNYWATIIISNLGALYPPTFPASTVLNMTFDADSPPTVVDGSIYGNNGTINGAIASSTNGCLLTNCYTFSGVSTQYIQVADSASLDCTNITISAWVKPVGLDEYPPSNYHDIVNKSSAYRLSIRSGAFGAPTGSQGIILFYLTGVTNWSTSGLDWHMLWDGAWHHIIASYDGTNASIYVDGRLNSSTAISGSISTSANVLQIGNTYKGTLDEVRIQNVGVDAAGALALYQSYGTVRAPRSYYVSSSGGSDSNDGLSSGAPWATLGKVYQQQFLPLGIIPGDSILFKRGDTWEGSLNLIWQKGTSQSNIIVDAYGTGANPKIYGDGRGFTWNAVSGYTGVYETTNTGIGCQTINRAWEGSTKLGTAPFYVPSVTWKTLTNGQYAYPFNTEDRLWVRTLDDAAPTNMTTFRASPYVYYCDYLQINNVDFESTHVGSIWNSSYVTLSNSAITYVINSSIYWNYTTNCLMTHCTAHTCGTELYVLDGISNTVRYCTLDLCTNVNGFPYENGDFNGVGLFKGKNNLVEYCNFINPSNSICSALDMYYENDFIYRWNYASNMGGFFIHGNNILVYGNVLNGNNNGSAGDCRGCPSDQLTLTVFGYGDLGVATNNYMLNNVFYNASGQVNVSSGIGEIGSFGIGGVVGTTGVFRNNIVYGASACVELFGDPNCDYNTYYVLPPNTASPVFGIWSSWTNGSMTIYHTFSNYLAAGTGVDTHSTYSDPQFISASPTSITDFRLQPTSPAVNTGQNMRAAGFLTTNAAYVDYFGTAIPVGSAPDMGAFENILRIGRVNNLNKR